MQARPYQEELLEKAKEKNIIVYLGTGSGKTFIAVMLIKHMRDLLGRSKKVVFLVNNVALLEQQAQVIRDCTGLSTASYCGADGVDHWDKGKWGKEVQEQSVMVFIHQVFLDAVAHGFISISNLALLVMDECHHAVKNHPYSKIMTDWYHPAKKKGRAVPKVLGLSASIVVKAVKTEEFRKEKTKLEMMLDAVVETADGISIDLFVNSAREKILHYRARCSLRCEEDVGKVIVSARKELWEVKEKELSVIMKSGADVNSKTTSADSLRKDFRFFVNNIFGGIGALLELGVYSLVSMETSLVEDIESKCERSDTIWYREEVRDMMAAITKKYFSSIVRIATSHILGFNGSEKEKILKFSGSKVLKLIEIIENKGFGQSEEKEMRCIVFVERKLTSLALHYLIWKLKLATVVDVGYCYSANANRNVKDPREAEEVNKEKHRMKETLRKFRVGAVNVLVSTSVVEEGIDVPSCNLVVKFDFPQTFRSYIQSKGRARKKASQYILLVEEGDSEKEARYKEWLGVYEMSMRECHSRREVQVEPDERDGEFYCTSEARVSGTQAMVLLYQYLQKIPVDRFTRLSPAWTIQISGNENQIRKNQRELFAGLGLSLPSPPHGYLARVQLPHKTPIHRQVEGKVKVRKEWAKRSAALEVIRLLHEKGELDDSLKVKKKEVVVVDEDSEDEDDARKEGTRGNRRFYRHHLSPLLDTKPCSPLYLHTVELELVKPLPNPRYHLHHPQDDPYCLGLLTTSPLPTMGPLEIFSSSGTVTANISCIKRIPTLSTNQLQMVIKFHQYIFSTCLALTDLLDPLDLPAPLLVPVLAGDLDLGDLSALCRKISARQSGSHVKVNSHAISAQFGQLEQYQDLVFYSIKPPASGPTHFFLEEISSDLTADSLMDGMGMSFTEYYKVYQQSTLRNTKQPLVRISSANRQLHMLSEGGEPVSDGKARTHRSYKVVELMGVEPIPAGLWMQAQMMPWVLHRVNSLMAALPLTQGWEREKLTLGKESRPDEDKLMQFMISSKLASNSSPSPGQMVQALTLSAAGDRWDMERMEILGDAFLKYSTTIFLHYTMADTCDEGDLSTARSKIVGNLNLFHIAESLGLASCGIVSTRLDPVVTWTPPGYQSAAMAGGGTVEEKVVELDKEMAGWGVGDITSWITREDLEKLRMGEMTSEEVIVLARERRKEHKVGGVKLRDFRLVSDKAQADCVEAMMGCYLLNCGMENCLDFMARIGINLSSTSRLEEVIERRQSKEKVIMQTPQKDAFCSNQVRNEKAKLQTLMSKLGGDQIEKITGYTFKEKSFLLQAFTHPSFGDNRLTASYEKLEFLGDAVLDYLVTCYIYSSTDADPGRLTDIRSALVCNNMFASLLTDIQLDQFILHCTPGIYKKIKEYLDDKWWDETQPVEVKVDKTLKQINEEDPPELDMVEVPKVLGDVFEALFGAIFLDSRHDLSVVWSVYRRLCPTLDRVVANPPLNIKKQLLEKFPIVGSVVFSSATQEGGGTVSVTVEVPAGGMRRKFKGKGRNKKLAVLAACKCALRKLGEEEEGTEAAGDCLARTE